MSTPHQPGTPGREPRIGNGELSRQDFEAALAARRDLGPEMEDAVVDSFVDRVESALARRDAHPSSVVPTSSPDSGKALALGIVTAVMGVPLTAITLAAAHNTFAFLMVWVGLVAINIAFGMGRRRP